MPQGIPYLDLPKGTRIAIRTARGADVELLTLTDRGSHRHSLLFGKLLGVRVLKAPFPLPGDRTLLVGQFGGREPESKIDFIDANCEELAPGVAVFVGDALLVIAEVEAFPPGT